MDELALQAKLFPPALPSKVARPEPDWAHVHRELASLHRTQILAAVEMAREERLLNAVASEGLRRAIDDLSRSLYWALGELRKHKGWRRPRPAEMMSSPTMPDTA